MELQRCFPNVAVAEIRRFCQVILLFQTFNHFLVLLARKVNVYVYFPDCCTKISFLKTSQARKGDIEKAKEMLAKSVEWRQTVEEKIQRKRP